MAELYKEPLKSSETVCFRESEADEHRGWISCCLILLTEK